ncbi:MAG: hypothetical protein AAFN77_13745 [Planctomycetota bacterium]
MKTTTNQTFWMRLVSWLIQVDRILRGDVTRPDGDNRVEINIPVVGVSVVVILLGVAYGFCMGVFALIHGVEISAYHRALMQTFASMCKVPLLFSLTLVITFPSLYVFNALLGSQLRVFAVLKLLVASLAVNLAVLASMGPILAFFSASTPNYPFIVLLNVVLFAIAGALGLGFLLQSLNRLSATVGLSSDSPAASTTKLETTFDTDEANPEASAEGITIVATAVTSPKASPHGPVAGPLDRPRSMMLSGHVKKVFVCWLIVFGMVGAQLGWILRPFIGSPDMPFTWFRSRQSNFFQAVFDTFWNLFSVLS